MIILIKEIIITNIKKLALILVPAFCFLNAFAQTDDQKWLDEIATHRLKQETEFKDPEKSPLSKEQIAGFTGLKYYAPDLKYRVRGKFTKNEKPVLFKMKTTTSRLPGYLKYGEVTFEIDSQRYTLEVYQSPEISLQPEYKNYLFIPFTDETNGHDTYEVGRYVDLTIPESEEITIDFNLSYSPYCSYRSGYSCPIPPASNHLPIAIPAGEKKYKKH